MDTALSHWNEWNDRCALALCSNETQHALRAYGARQFRHYARFTAGGAASESGLSPSDQWHLFETHLSLRQTRAGKRYKDWLFARVSGASDPPLQVIQGGAGLLMRDVVRAFIRAERPQDRSVSLDAPLSDGADRSFTLHDLLPGALDPAQDLEIRELTRVADLLADASFADLAPRERVAIAAREQGLSLSHPTVERCAGCRKSMLHAAHAAAVGRVADRVRAEYRDEPADSIRLLAVLTLRALGARVLGWAISEKSCARLFSTGKKEIAAA